MSRSEYRSAIGLPCGQLIGHSVAASDFSSQTILSASSRMLTLIAARHAIDAAIARRTWSIETFRSSRSAISRISPISRSISSGRTPAGAPFTAMVRCPNGSVSNPLACSSSAMRS